MTAEYMQGTTKIIDLTHVNVTNDDVTVHNVHVYMYMSPVI